MARAFDPAAFAAECEKKRKPVPFKKNQKVAEAARALVAHLKEHPYKVVGLLDFYREMQKAPYNYKHHQCTFRREMQELDSEFYKSYWGKERTNDDESAGDDESSLET